MAGWKDNLAFMLIETREPGNIGAAARALKNLGFSNLDLVRPLKVPSDEAYWFAHGAEDILAGVEVYPELESALMGKSVVIGTTRRLGKRRGTVYPVRDAADKIRRLSENNRIAILFGREDRGLTNEEAAACSFMISIPAAPANPSFNLSQAVLIVAYELSYTDYAIRPQPSIITKEEFSTLFQRLSGLMKMAGYAPKGVRDHEEEILSDLKRLIARASLTEREARMLHGIISQIEEGLRKKGWAEN